MSRNSAEYKAVLAVKEALIKAPTLKTEIEAEQSRIKETQRSIAAEEGRMNNPVPTPYHTNSVIAEVQRPYLEAENLRAQKRTRQKNVFVPCFFACVLLLFLTVGFLLAAVGVEYSWSLNSDYSMKYLGDFESREAPEQAALRFGGCASLLGVGGCLLLCILLRKVAGRVYGGDDDNLFYLLFCIFGGIGCIVCGFALMGPVFEGAWYDFLWIVSLILAMFTHLHLCLMAVAIVWVYLIGLLFFVGRITHPPMPVMPRRLVFNMEPFYATDVYRRAYELDQAEAPAQKAAIVENAKKNLVSLRAILEKRQTYVKNLQSRLSHCRETVDTSVLHPSYRNLEMVSIILHYFELNRAETIVQAVNEYTHDKQYEKWIETQKRIAQEIQEAIDRQTAEYAAMRRAQEAAAESYAREQERTRQAIAAENRRSIEAADARARSLQSEIYNSGVRLENSIHYS